MERFIDNLRIKINKSREIKPNSLNAYILQLKKLKQKLDPKFKNNNLFKDTEKVIGEIMGHPTLTTKKNRLTAVIVAVRALYPNDKKTLTPYSEKLTELNKEYMDFLEKQEKTDTQKKNWLSYDDIIKVAEKLGDKIKEREIPTAEAGELKSRDYQLLQKYVCLITYINFPLRNDFADMVVSTRDTYEKLPKKNREDTNFLILDGDAKYFQINQFKNRKKMEAKTFTIPPNLSKIINFWLIHNTSGYYLTAADKKTPMSPNSLTKYLNTIFRSSGKRISTSMIRHIVISHELEGTPTLKEKAEEKKDIEDRFLHSKGIHELYRKVD